MHASVARRIVVSVGLLTLGVASRHLAAQDLAALQKDIAAAGGRVIVGIKPADAPRGMARPGVRALSKAQVQAVADRLTAFGLTVTRNYDLITAVAGVARPEAVERLLRDPNVEYVMPDRIHRLLDDVGPRRTATPLIETTPYGVTRIRAPEAWIVPFTPNFGAGVKVGILDTGGDFDHEDLAFAGGFDAILGSTNPADWDDNVFVCQGHGTHVAGTVAAVRGNNLGLVGVAPSASVYAIQIFVEYIDNFGQPQCGAFTSDIVAGVEWAVGNGIQVVNMSYGGFGFDPAEHAAYQAAAAAGVHLVAASGNEGLPASGVTPAAYPEVIAVSATNSVDEWANFSNFGPEVFVSAPGVSVPSTLPGNTYGAYSGTSMASPHATGLVALLLAIEPTLSNASLRGLLGAGAVDLGAAGRDDLFGEGRIDALNSVGLATQQTTTATQLALVQGPVNGTSGQPLVPAPVVEIRDAQNQPVLQAGIVVTATVTSGPGRATLLGKRIKKTGAPGESRRSPVEPATTAVVTNASGQAVFSTLTINTVITATHELTFSSGGRTPVVSAPFSVTGSVTTLSNGVSVPNLSAATGTQTYYVLTIPAGLGTITAAITGGSGDADLFIQHAVPPTIGSFDCISAFIGNDDNCTVPNPTAGDWYIMLLAYEGYTGLTLTVTASGTGATQLAMVQQPQNTTSGQPLAPGPSVQLQDAQGQPIALLGLAITAAISSGPGEVSVRPLTRTGKAGGAARSQRPVRPAFTTVLTDANGLASFTDLAVTSLTTADHQLVFSGSNVTSVVSNPFSVTGTTPTTLTNDVAVPGLSGAAESNAYFVITVPAGRGSLRVTIGGGTGDADLYVRQGALPTTASFTCRPFLVGNNETCSHTLPAPGEWYVMVRGFEAYAGVTLTATHLAVATQLSLVQQPQNTASAQPLVPAPIVQLLDALNQPVLQAGVTVTAAISSGPGRVSAMPAPTAPAQGAGEGKRPPAEPLTRSVTTNASGQAVFSNLFVTTLTTADHELSFSAPNVTPAVSNPFSVSATVPTALTNGVAVPGLGGAVGSLAFYVLTVPAGQVALSVTTAGGTGDPDLYVKFGDLPTTVSYDCQSITFTSAEACNFSDPAAGQWYVLVRGFSIYSGITLTATYSPPIVEQHDVTVTGAGTGSGTVTGGGLNCTITAGAATGTCTATHNVGADISLTATPGASQTFNGWSGDCTGSGPCPLDMTQARNVTADFSHPPADVSNMVAELTGTPTLSPEEIARWDCNSTTTFDVGDLLCYLDGNPGLTLAPEVMTAILLRKED